MQVQSELPVIDVTAQAAASGLLRLAEQGFRRCGDLFTLRFGDGSETTVLASADHVRLWQSRSEAFTKDFDRLPTSAALTRLLLGPTLLTARQGPEWKRMRSEMTSLMRLSKPWFADALDTATAGLLHDIDTLVRNDRPIPVMPLALDWAVRSVCRPILGAGVRHDAAVELVETLQSCFLVMARQGATEAAAYSSLAEFARAKAQVADVLEVAFESARKEEDTIAAACLAAMPQDMDRDRQKQELGTVVIGLIAASLHINALALVWLLTSLAKDPELQSRLFQETEALPLLPTDQVTRTPLAFASVRETQRLFPALPFIERRLAGTLSFGGQELAGGSMVLFANWLIQRDPRYWSDPKSFDPARFLPRADQTPGSYFPFGTGPRTCSGMNLVFQQLTYTLRALIGRFEFTLAPETRPGDLTPVMQVNLEPRGSITLRARHRTQSLSKEGTIPGDVHA